MNEPIKPEMTNYSRQVLVCIGDSCASDGKGMALFKELKEKIAKLGLDSGDERVLRSKVGCLGICKSGPLICIQPDGVWYYNIDSKKLDRIIEQHLIAGQPVKEWMFHHNLSQNASS